MHQIKITVKGLSLTVLKTFNLESLAFDVKNHRSSRVKPSLLKLWSPMETRSPMEITQFALSV